MSVPAALRGGAEVAVRSVSATAPAGWDRRTVDAPGGHVMQGTTWAEHRRAAGQEPLFVTFSDNRGALVLSRRQRPIGTFVTARAHVQ